MARHPTGFHFMIIPFVAHLVILSRQSFHVNPFLGAQKLGFDCDEACSERRSRKTTAAKRGRMNFISLFDVCCLFVLNKKSAKVVMFKAMQPTSMTQTIVG